MDTERILGHNGNIDWLHSFNQRLRLDLTYDFSRLATTDIPYWQNRADISGSAGIQGNSRSPIDWGPPTLSFSGGSGIVALTDSNSAHNRNETNKFSASLTWNHSGHNLAFGFDFRRQEFNYLSQQNPRGTFTFTGAATQGTANGAAVGGSDWQWRKSAGAPSSTRHGPHDRCRGRHRGRAGERNLAPRVRHKSS